MTCELFSTSNMTQCNACNNLVTQSSNLPNHKHYQHYYNKKTQLHKQQILMMEHVNSLIRTCPDFPVKGINFRDFGPVFANSEATTTLRQALFNQVKHLPITKVLVLETRGYIFGCPLAHDLKAGIVPVRKAGKLPGECIELIYDLEYKKGEKCEIQAGLLNENDVVLIHDDLIATGGTAQAAIDIARKAGVKEENIYVSFICKLPYIDGVGSLKHYNKVFCIMDV